jgi:hypothetical protein
MAETQGFTSPADPAGTGQETQQQLNKQPSTDTGSVTTLDGVTKAESQQMQFPSLAGQSGVEVAERSDDVGAKVSKKHRKVFRVETFGREIGDDFDHAPNKTATRQFMVDHGLRPVGDVTFAGADPYDDRNTDLAYEVEAVPAAVAKDDPALAHVVVSVD